jgi:hypothetical protein
MGTARFFFFLMADLGKTELVDLVVLIVILYFKKKVGENYGNA